MIFKKEEFKILFTFLQDIVKDIRFRQEGDTIEVDTDLSPEEWYALGKKVGKFQALGDPKEKAKLEITSIPKKKFIRPVWLKSYYILAIALFILLYSLCNTQSMTNEFQNFTEKSIKEVKSSLDKKSLNDTITPVSFKQKTN